MELRCAAFVRGHWTQVPGQNYLWRADRLAHPNAHPDWRFSACRLSLPPIQKLTEDAGRRAEEQDPRTRETGPDGKRRLPRDSENFATFNFVVASLGTKHKTPSSTFVGMRTVVCSVRYPYRH